MSSAVDYDPFASPALARAIPTTEAQREVWLGDKLGRDASLSFNEAAILRLQGAVDVRALQRALTALVARHDLLRATVNADGSQLLIAAELALDSTVRDLTELSPEERERALEVVQMGAVEHPFDLEKGPLFRVLILKLADNEHAVLLSAHHIICDGWSYGVILEDLGALYAACLADAAAGAVPPLAAAVSYADYVAWEASESTSPAMAEHEKFWLKEYSGGSLPVLDLPVDRPRAPQRSFTSLRIDHAIDKEVVASLRKLGGQQGASLFAALFTGFAATLHRLTGQDDIVIGVPAAGQSASGLRAMVGHCVNLLPVRTLLDAKQPFSAVLEKTASHVLDAFEHQTLTYGTLLQKLPLKRDPSRLPLVSVMFNVDQAVASTSSAFTGCSADFRAVPRHFENFEIFVNCVPDAGGLRLETQYNTDLFDAATMARWLASFETLLRAAVAAPTTALGALPIVNDAALAQARALQPSPTPYPADALMHTAFVAQARATPARVALRASTSSITSSITYGELDARSNQLAHELRARGVGRGDRVGLCLARGIDMVVGLLAVLKSGAAYVPLDPSFPKARLDYYAEDAKLALLVTESAVAAAAPVAWRSDVDGRVLLLDDAATASAMHARAQTAPAASDKDARPEDPAYVIYTSGSTGKPKGVVIPHRAVANFLISMAKEPGIRDSDVLAAVTTLSFDIAVLELMLPLTVGASVVIVSRDSAMDGNLLKKLLIDERVTMMQATPGMWRLLLDSDFSDRKMKALIGGEGLPADLALTLAARVGELWNMYGPTETTVWSTLWQVDPGHVKRVGVSIGRPIANTTVWILDDNLQPCPVGVPGEICIGGHGVTLGYLDRPELTADRFRAVPFADDARKIYRTGDRGRFRNDGLLEHLGRLDFQVKVRGYRIELGEIEAGCNEHASVAQTVVLAREDRPGDVRLVAYVALKSGRVDEGGKLEPELKAQLKGKLPEYMIPQHVVVLAAIPLLANGKVDRKSLPAPDLSSSLPQGERVAARTPLEQQVL
ncbi:MAG TPA: amino acid adenylation domain-containing protein, partial [Myxococcota bacterium]